MVRSERLAGIGLLAAGVAHEINNPLSTIAMAAESLESRSHQPLTKAEHDDTDLTCHYLGMIQREAFRCQQITSKLLEFSRGDDGPRTRTDLTSMILEVLSMVRCLGKYRDRNVEFAHQKPCYVQANGPEIKQVILNLVINALEAMDGGQTLRIEITEQIDQVFLTFEDEGCGMTPEVLENLFEPFFTQTKNGKGTGLGMSISHRIISDHNGTIEARSDGPGQGSRFRILLPRRQPTAEPEGAA